MTDRKTYLGDGAYAEMNRFGELILTTEDGLSIQNRVVLGYTEYSALLAFVERVRAEEAEAAPRCGGEGWCCKAVGHDGPCVTTQMLIAREEGT